MAKDVRKEQLVLLKFERKLAGLAAFVAAGSATASGFMVNGLLRKMDAKGCYHCAGHPQSLTGAN